MKTHPTGLPRAVELPLALLGLVVSLPVLAVVAIAVRCSSRGPVLFRQERVGLLGQGFTLFKFRSMQVDSAGPCVTSKGDARVTLVGRVLRKFKLDELPELWNVVRGEMSLVGPRPEASEYVDTQDPLWQRVLEARPGLTDPVTVKLRNEEELLGCAGEGYESFYLTVLQPYKLAGYIEYLDKRTWRSDLRVLLDTGRLIAFPSAASPPSIDELRSAVAGGYERKGVAGGVPR